MLRCRFMLSSLFRIYVILFVFDSVFITDVQSLNLLPHGKNVNTTYETQKIIVKTWNKILKHKKVCTLIKCYWIWRCRKCRNVSYYDRVQVDKEVTKTVPKYVCKHGWKQSGRECTIPICIKNCENHGSCIAPDVCNCTAQWNGTRCEYDVDECDADSDVPNLCQEKCINYPGGYNCSCSTGHVLTSNGKNCSDHDECAHNEHDCQQGCYNYPGGYRCTCRAGYTLNSQDNKTCKANECEQVQGPPVNGAMRCTGNTTDHSCVFDCNTGYRLNGSRRRVCSASGKWTGDKTSCIMIYCPKIKRPPHAFVYSPCETHFGSNCTLGCIKGYFMEGQSKAMCTGNGSWHLGNSSCREISPCDKNPCAHGGVCTQLSFDRYICNCTKTGYAGTNCRIGYITTPSYPTLSTKISSGPLTFRSSPLNSGDLILTPRSRDVIFSPAQMIFNSTFQSQSVTISSRKNGIHIVTYFISGRQAHAFASPENDIILVDTVERSTDRSNFTLDEIVPIGCNNMELSHCSDTDVIMNVSSTSPWKRYGPIASSDGVIVLRTNTATFPLSLLGTSLPSGARSKITKKCNNDYDDVKTKKLMNDLALVRSFLKAVKPSLPMWLKLILKKEMFPSQFQTSDVEVELLSGEELQSKTFAKGQPISEKSSYLLLRSSKIIISIGNNDKAIKTYDHSHEISLAIELCSDSVILSWHKDYAEAIKNSTLFTSLAQHGWELLVLSVQVSKTLPIVTNLPKQRFWDGFVLIRSNIVMKGKLALVSELTKAFDEKSRCSLEFKGTMVIDVSEIDNMMKSPFDQAWMIELYGNLKLSVELMVEGFMSSMVLSAHESSSFVSFGDDQTRQGLYISHKFKESPFLGSDLDKFVEVVTSYGMEVFYEMGALQSKPLSFEKNNDTNAISMIFHGTMRFYELKFENLVVVLTMQAGRNGGVLLHGRKSQYANTNYGIFTLNNPEVRMSLSSQSQNHSCGFFQSTVNIFGFKDSVNVTFNHNGVHFHAAGKVFGTFPANVTCHASLNAWKNLKFLARGEFTRNEAGLVSSLNRNIKDYAHKVYANAWKRYSLYEKRQKRAEERLRAVEELLEGKKREVNKTRHEYIVAKMNLENAQRRQDNASQRLLANSSTYLLQLCPDVGPCPDICQAGIACRQCKLNITGKSKNTCLSTCYKSVTRRVKTNTSRVSCVRHQCDRIYHKEGLKNLQLHQTLSELQNDIFSFGRSGYVQRTLERHQTSHIFPGYQKDGLCLNSKCKPTSHRFYNKNLRIGYWNCSVRPQTCGTLGSRYELYQVSYMCEKPCDSIVATETLPSTCCTRVPCAFRSVNRTCVAQNHFCNRLRTDALKKLANSSNDIDLWKSLEDAVGEVHKRRMDARLAEIRLKSARVLLNITQDSVKRLRKTYNMSLNAGYNVSRALWRKLKLKNIFLDSKSVVENASFSVYVRKERENYLLPVKLKVKIQGKSGVFAVVIDFKNVALSLKNAAHEIVRFYGKIEDSNYNGGKKQYSEGSSDEKTFALSNLKKYHKLCSEFTNYKSVLRDIASDLFYSTTEVIKNIKNFTKVETAIYPVNVTKILESFNPEYASKLGVTIDKESYYRSLANDTIMLESLQIEKEARMDGLKPAKLYLKLLLKNWFSAMENLFDVVATNCNGLEDCVFYVINRLYEVNEAQGFPGSQRIRKMIENIQREFGQFKRTDFSTRDANNASSNVLNILNDMNAVKLFCARAPNITEQPEPLTNIGEGNSFKLKCNASGDELMFYWKFNNAYLNDQTSNTLYIKNASSKDSGNYTCIVFNHISMEISAPAFVVVHSAPHIKTQPVERLNAILFSNNWLTCLAESLGNNVTYQWYFKALNSSVFIKLSEEVFPYLNLLSIQNEQEGRYFCRVSSIYGSTRSTNSYVKVLNFILPIPQVQLSISLSQSQLDLRRLARSNPTQYENAKAGLAQKLASVLNITAQRIENTLTNSSLHFSSNVENLRVVKCRGQIPDQICKWSFNYNGAYDKSGKHLNKDPLKVIGSLRRLRAFIGGIAQAVNGNLLFERGKMRYLVERNSLSVDRVRMTCPLGTSLEDLFKCVDCIPGYYGRINGNGIARCLACPLGTYQHESGRQDCIQCPKGFTTVDEGAVNVTQCKALSTTKEPNTRYTTTEKVVTHSEDHVTTDEKHLTSGHLLKQSGNKDKRFVIGGSIAGLLLLCVLVLALLHFVRKRLALKRSGNEMDDKNVVVKEDKLELHALDNPAFDEDENHNSDVILTDNPSSPCTSSLSPNAVRRHKYETNHVVNANSKDANLDVCDSYENGDAVMVNINPLYQSNPALDVKEEQESIEKREPDPRNNDITEFKNKLYKPFQPTSGQKFTLTLTDVTIVEEDV